MMGAFYYKRVKRLELDSKLCCICAILSVIYDDTSTQHLKS